MNTNRINTIHMDIAKKLIITLTSAILAFMQPVQNTVHLLVFLFIANLLIGVFHDIVINRKGFEFKKFIWAVIEFLIYVGIVCGVYIIGYFQGDIAESQYVIKVISYLFIYAYTTNIFKNLILIRPHNIVFRFIYYALSLAFIKRIPYFAEFLNQHNKEKSHEE